MASTTPDMFGEDAANTWFKAAILPEGPLAETFLAAVKEGVRECIQSMLAEATSPLSVAISAANSSVELRADAQDENIKAVSDTVASLTKEETDLDAKFPWRKYLRDCDPSEIALGWRRLNIDKDWLSNAADQMDDPAMANSMAAVCNNPDSPVAKRLQNAIMLKNTPKTSWKALCLSSHGGGPDKFRAFMSDKSAVENDSTVAALSRKCLHLYLLYRHLHLII